MPTIDSSLRTTALRLPDAEALTFGDRHYTYAELDRQVEHAAGDLAARGVSKGDRVALIAPSSDLFVIAFYAAHRLGAIFVPVNPASAAPELLYILRDSGATALLYDAALTATIEAARASGLPPACGIVGALAPVDVSAVDGPPVPDVQVDEHDDAMILYTSGTTGDPKGALFDHHRAVWVGVNVIGVCGLREGDRILHVAPLYHAAELCMLLVPGTMLGAKHVVHQGFDPTAVLDTMEAERITFFFGVPTMYQFLLRQPGIETRDLSAWRSGLFGAAPMPASAVEQLTSTLPHVEFIQMCGQTEAGPGGIYVTAEQVRARPDVSGRQALPFTQCRVVDLDGNDVAAGGTGELLLRGETVMKGYWNKPAETAAAIRDGWLHTGDIARVDADGYMTLVDRLKDLIISGGRNVYSVEVENALAAHPAVADCAVVGRPHPDFGESIVAVVRLHEGASLTLDDVRAFCAGRISDYKVPHDLVIADIPRNPSGKVLKRQIRVHIEALSNA